MTRRSTYRRRSGRPRIPDRPLARWIALLAVALYVVAPFASVPPAVAGQIQICTAHGIVWMPTPGDDNAPPAHGMPNCPACALSAHAVAAAKAPLPTSAALPLPRLRGTIVLLPATVPSPRAVTVAVKRSRAPPLPA